MRLKFKPVGGGGGAITDGTAVPNDVISGKTFYAGNNELKTGILTLSGDVTAAEVPVGKTFYTTDPKAKQTGTAPVQAMKTWVPSTSSLTIPAGTYCSGKQTIIGDADLLPGNIRSGVNIFGVTGNFSGALKNASFTYSYSNKKVSDTITGLEFTPFAFVFSFILTGGSYFGGSAVAGWKTYHSIGWGAPEQIASDTAYTGIWNRSGMGSSKPNVELNISGITEGEFSYSITHGYSEPSYIYVTGITVYGV